MLRSNLSSSQKSLADKKVKVAGPSNQHCLSSYTTQPYEWIWTKNKNTVSDAPATFGKSRQFTIAFSNFWHFMTTFCNFSQLLAIIDLLSATLQFLAVFGNFWQLLPCHHAIMSSFHHFIIPSGSLYIVIRSMFFTRPKDNQGTQGHPNRSSRADLWIALNRFDKQNQQNNARFFRMIIFDNANWLSKIAKI